MKRQKFKDELQEQMENVSNEFIDHYENAFNEIFDILDIDDESNTESMMNAIKEAKDIAEKCKNDLY